MTMLLSLVLALASVVNPAAPTVHPVPSPSAPAIVAPLVFTSFQFKINNVVVPAVQSIDGLTNVVIQYRQKVPGKMKWGTITLKRGVTSDNTLFEWRQKVIDGKIDEARSTCTIDAMQSNGVIMQYTLHRCWPSKYVGHSRTSPQAPESAEISFDSATVR